MVLTQFLSKFKIWESAPVADAPRIPTTEENLSRALGKVEPYVVFLQRVLIWENPKQSVLFLVLLHGIFWFVVALELRFFFLVFGTILVVLLYKTWVEKVWPEIGLPLPAEQGNAEDWTPLHPRVLSVPEISHHLNKVFQLVESNYVWLKNFRRDQPGVFCCLVSSICVLLMWIGWTVSGTTLLYCIFMSLSVAPGVVIHLIPSNTLQNLFFGQSNINTYSKENDSDSEEYLLKPSASDMIFLQQACEPEVFDREEEDDEFNMPSADFRNAADDITDSGAPSLLFLHGINTMPAPEDLSLDSTDFSFAVSNSEQAQKVLMLPVETSDIKDRSQQKNSPKGADVRLSDTDESISPMDTEGIHFRTRHFKTDSSSEEETSLSQGNSQKSESAGPLGTVVGDAAAAVLSYSSAGALNLASFGAAVGQSLISSVISSSNQQASSTPALSKPLKEEDDLLSDTDDFEMISEEDFANM